MAGKALATASWGTWAAQRGTMAGLWLRRLTWAGLYLLLLVMAVAFLFPFYTMIVGSFMNRAAIFSLNPNLWPNPLIVTNYAELFRVMPFHRYLFNSFMLAAGQMIGALFFCSLAGFTFAKRRFPGREVLFIFVLVTMMFPYQSTLIPWYLLMSKLGWLDTFLPLWIPWWASAFGIFLMRQYMVSSVPDELVEAATMDGCTLFGIYWRVVLPISIPGLTVLGILKFVNAWNDFLYSLLVFTGQITRTAPLALALFLGSEYLVPRFNLLFAGSVLATLPLIIVFFTFQRRLMEGILGGAIKG
ncbi:MAG: carbohydrate ABC transporter permease [Chloroflexi bacterium]|nr:carbohydrate ABC transporter permease [Chloroflexota bacterium]